MEVETLPEKKATEVGSYFVANYPPFSIWSPEHKPAILAALDRPPKPDTKLGLYLHIPFCRKRCKFCYFRVYNDKNARSRFISRLFPKRLIFMRAGKALEIANSSSSISGAERLLICPTPSSNI